MSPLDSSLLKQVPLELRLSDVDVHTVVMSLLAGKSIEVAVNETVQVVKPLAGGTVTYIGDRMSFPIFVEALDVRAKLTVWVTISENYMFESPNPNELDMDFEKD